MKLHGCVLLVCLVVMGVVRAGAEEAKLATRISHVTVYPEWAFVTRSGEVALQPGMNRFTLAALPAWIDEDSVKVRLDTEVGYAISGAIVDTVYLQQYSDADVRQAQQAVQGVEDRIEDLNNQLAALEKERLHIENTSVWKLEKIPYEGAAREVKVEELAKVEAFIGSSYADNLGKATALRRQIRDLQPELGAKRKSFETLSGRARLEQKQIRVDIEANGAGKGVVQISYLISGASWYPVYDARATAERDKVAVTSKAVVQQSTGEDWQDAQFTLSTTQPYLVREKPSLEPWYVEGGQQIEQTTSFSVRSSSSKSSKLAQVQAKQAWYNDLNRDAFEMVQGNLSNAIEVVRQVEERGMTVEFKAPGRYAVLTDGKAVTLQVGEVTLEAARRYVAVPAVSRSTYVTGEMRNTGAFPFLPGTANVYVGGSLIGKSRIDTVAEGERFELFLGLDERIKVTRHTDRNRSSMSLFGDRRRLNMGYVIEVSSFLTVPAEIHLTDQMPVSRDAAVKVKAIGMDPKPTSVEQGILTWVLTVAPGQSQQMKFEFQIDYPVDMMLDNVQELARQVEAAM